MSDIKDCLRPGISKILGIRDQIGAKIHNVFLVTRTWSGSFIGDGTSTESEEQILPTPQIVDLTHNFKSLAGGAYQQGDLLLKGISKDNYPEESDVNGNFDAGADNIEKFYRINGKEYQAISVKEKLVTWDVQIRKVSHRGYS